MEASTEKTKAKMKWILGGLLLFSGVASLKASEKILRVPSSGERILCTTLTQAQQVRFNRCRNGEVMTGIQALEPLTVYCTTLLANCRGQVFSIPELTRPEKP